MAAASCAGSSAVVEIEPRVEQLRACAVFDPSGSLRVTMTRGFLRKDDLASLHARPDVESAVVARLEPGVLGTVNRCAGGWCRIGGRGFEGWIQQAWLWGVYPNEKLD
jgi:SH3-like domain-containing protein